MNYILLYVFKDSLIGHTNIAMQITCMCEHNFITYKYIYFIYLFQLNLRTHKNQVLFYGNAECFHKYVIITTLFFLILY